MTGEQKQRIYILRKQKKSFAEISEIIDIPRNTIKTFCWRSGMTDADLENGFQNKGFRGFCKNCGKELEQKSKSRPKVYCSDQCRRKWWNEHHDKLRKAPENFRKCIVCGVPFHAYPSQKRKYCSHQCYITARYGNEGGTDN